MYYFNARTYELVKATRKPDGYLWQSISASEAMKIKMALTKMAAKTLFN